MKVRIYFSLILLLFNFSCRSQFGERKPNPEAVKLSNKAIELYNQVRYKLPEEQLNDTLLNTAIEYLDKAIKIDKEYYLAYMNKANILVALKRNDEAIETIEAVHQFKKNYAEGYTTQGFFNEKANKKDQADEKYKKAIIAYDNRITETNKIEDKANKAFLLMFTEDRASALKEIDKILEAYPDNALLKNMKYTIETFVRENFIDSL